MSFLSSKDLSSIISSGPAPSINDNFPRAPNLADDYIIFDTGHRLQSQIENTVTTPREEPYFSSPANYSSAFTWEETIHPRHSTRELHPTGTAERSSITNGSMNSLDGKELKNIALNNRRSSVSEEFIFVDGLGGLP